MKITEISVHAGRTFNDPHEQFSNFRPGITIRAELRDDEDAAAMIAELRRRAEDEVEEAKRSLLASAKKRDDEAHARWKSEDQAKLKARAAIDDHRRALREALGKEEADSFLKGLADDDLPF